MYNNRVSIQDLRVKFKALFGNTEYLLAGLIIGASVASFGLGRLSAGEGDVHTLPEPQSTGQEARALPTTTPAAPPTSPTTATVPAGGYVASKNGTKYHLPWCSGAKQISEQNKIFFATKAEAEAAGYTPASNCKGI
jgi:hypothetical protein